MPTHTQPSDQIRTLDSLCRAYWIQLRSQPGYHASETRQVLYPWQLRVSLMEHGKWQAPHDIHTALVALHDALWPGEEIFYAALVRQVKPSQPHTDIGAPPGTVRCRSCLLPLHSEHRTYSTQRLSDTGAMVEEMWDAPLTVNDWRMEEWHRSGQESYTHHPDTQCRDFVVWNTRR